VAARIVPLCTIGCEGRTPDDLAAALQRNGVARVVDVTKKLNELLRKVKSDWRLG